MQVHDLSGNLRIESVKRLQQALQRSTTPEQSLRALQQGLAEANGFVPSVLLSTRGLPAGQYRVVQMRLEEFRPDQPHAPPISESAPPHSGGVMATIIGRSEPQLIQEVDWASDPFFGETLHGYASIMAVPFASDNLPITWVILLKRPPDRFAVLDLEEAVQRVAIIGSLLENQTLAGQLAAANQRIEHDAKQVGELQRALLPASVPQIAGLQIAVNYEPSGHAGGDVYDFFPLDERDEEQPVAGAVAGVVGGGGGPERWCIFVGDAAGHGLAAAVVMAIVQAVLHAHPAGIARPSSLLAHANRQLCRKGIGGFVTAFLGIYEPGLRRLTYANAGHPRPLLRRSSDGTVSELDAVGSYPLGIDESEAFKQAMVFLQPGDTLLLYTDGITEARNMAGDQFGSARLTRLLGNQADLAPEPRSGLPKKCANELATELPAALIQRLHEAVRAHEQGRSPEDDQTLVAARAL
jgi:sigma-B regulation protein RsbU (phosphoserine phosphatase)